MAEIKWGKREDHTLLNTDILRIDGPDKVSGRAKYSHDVRLPGMLYGRVLGCPFPSAKPKVDISGVDVEGAFVAMPIEDALRDGATTWLWQPIAAVAAETPELAEDALRQIRVEYEEQKWAVTPDQALGDDAPRIGRDGNVVRPSERGDLDETEVEMDECDAVVEAEYTIPIQHHACLETHGVVVDYSGGDEATVYASTQFTHGVSGDAARELGLERANVVTLVEHMGGGFGAKFGLDLPGMIACRLAKESKRPVHLMLDRRSEFLAAGNRSGGITKMTGGMMKDGTLRALVSDITRLGGVGMGANPGQPYIYSAGTSYTTAKSVLTNTDSSRAMRAPGHPQASFAIESIIDELAAELGLDQLEVRKKNLADEVYHRQLDRAAKEIGWHDHANKARPAAELPDVATGIGFGVATWGGGGRKVCQVDVKIENDGSVVASVGSQDLGTGTRTYLAAIVAEELGLTIDQVSARIGDSRFGNANASGGSTTTPSLAPSIKVAAHKAREAFFERVAPLLEAQPAELKAKDGKVFVAAEPDRSIPWASACAGLGEAGVEARGEWQQDLQARGIHGAQAAKVEVDTLTGELRVVKFVAVHDVGLPLNRLALRSQINGGVIEALSYALFEERIIEPWLGAPLNASFEEYKLAGSMDMPEFVSIIDDDDDREAVIGMAEATIIPGQSAIANAIFNACGVRLRDMPFTRDKILMGLASRG
ncbi:MAG: xanthine dehydrogenase family protein molybdopterin-binding subunit [Planctomycetota bacterium]